MRLRTGLLLTYYCSGEKEDCLGTVKRHRESIYDVQRKVDQNTSDVKLTLIPITDSTKNVSNSSIAKRPCFDNLILLIPNI